MNRDDLLKLVGAESTDNDYLPVAFLLRNGYACAGYYNTSVNDGMRNTCVLLNAKFIELQDADKATHRPTISDFNEFLEEVVVDVCRMSDDGSAPSRDDVYGKTIPLTAIPLDEIAVVYPVAHMSALMQRAKPAEAQVPSFLDLNKSEIVRLLRVKLW